MIHLFMERLQESRRTKWLRCFALEYTVGSTASTKDPVPNGAIACEMKIESCTQSQQARGLAYHRSNDEGKGGGSFPKRTSSKYKPPLVSSILALSFVSTQRCCIGGGTLRFEELLCSAFSRLWHLLEAISWKR